eukprot:CAMPEP_0177201456 /NCGR_PEP_ID=MMETSP0367-20130122/26758_1 /TAXON_ID=447022 ORGANISM="Scrippsiella hangoei-like, Strain SHHI-4" /NCGR_SAMPLE_ID=MMETSP0367 /ASSEMBLY_ACC=CAM_ASM_000362 /LENGTH=396 /DNA_ID=CAMNT_0018649955 /DNA_START=58 /DNA_END=1248 /DNA_ORIENTATION=+
MAPQRWRSRSGAGALVCLIAGVPIGRIGAGPFAFSSASVSRRGVLGFGGVLGAGGLGGGAGAAWAENAPAPSGGTLHIKRVIAESGLEDWSYAEYEAMRDDEPRTKAYEAAIGKRLKGMQGGGTVVVDIGTGALALLAIMAAKAGATKVYAIEINPEAAQNARETVKKEKLDKIIEVITGDSMKVDLPEKVDLIVSELIGSIATQEGVEPIIKDAEKRFLKEAPGSSCPNMIPLRVQTLVAPIKYTEHRIMSFAAKRGVMSRGKAADGTLRPLRLRSKTKDLVFLSDPQVLESFEFCQPGATKAVEERSLRFDISKKKADDAKDFSGFAMWTRLVVDEENVVDVQTQKVTSHWAYVVALMDDKPIALVAPGTIELKGSVDYSAKPVRYTLEAELPV